MRMRDELVGKSIPFLRYFSFKTQETGNISLPVRELDLYLSQISSSQGSCTIPKYTST